MDRQHIQGLIVMKFGTQAKFARTLGESRQRVSEAINNRYALPEGKRVVWAALLGCEPDELIIKGRG